jgi:tetratricopeptide (TPR) repeat protein
MTIFARPSEWTRSGGEHPEPAAHHRTHHYFAFLSYSHRDEPTAKWLHESLEKYRVPHHLVGKLTDNGPIPRRLTPIFRDIGELPASGDLGTDIRAAIAGSRYLIVLCSPEAAKSKWANAEIEAFKRTRPEGCVFAAILDGEPFASDLPGREAEECLPAALRFHYDRRGKRTVKRAEPLAADLREPGESRRLGFLKLVAGMLGLGLDELIQRETVRRHRRMAAIAASSFVGMLVAAGLAVTAIQARDAARDQRREAESLVGFMLGDLRQKLEPVGRLDVLDGVGSRVLAYYRKQDAAELSDEALLQRSQALGLMGQTASLRGDLDRGLEFYREALKGTAEAIRRDPSDPERLFEHAQHLFWIGAIARDRGQAAETEKAWRAYKRLADRMVALEPDNMRWRMESGMADTNLGTILYEQRRFAEARSELRRALQTIDALATADPSNKTYQLALTEAIAWMADAEMSNRRLDEAIGLRRRQIALLRQLLAASGDVSFRQRLVPAYRGLGNLYAWRGRPDLAIEQMRSGLAEAERLVSHEPENSIWLEFATKAQLNLASLLLANGESEEAATRTQAGCHNANRLIARDRTDASWRGTVRNCLMMRAKLALRSGANEQALQLGREALAAARSVNSSDRIGDGYAAAEAGRLIGDAHRALGDRRSAISAWQAALALLPAKAPEQASETSERRMLLHRLGRSEEARRLAKALAGMGYQEPESAGD